VRGRVSKTRALIASAAYVAIFIAISFAATDPEHRFVFVGLVLAAGASLLFVHLRCTLPPLYILLGAVALRVVVFWMPPTLSDDAYRYVWDGRIQHDGVNPYRLKPSDSEFAPYHTEVLYKRLNSKDYYSVYAPLSQAIFWAGALGEPNDWLSVYYRIKFIFLLMELAAIIVLLRTVSPNAALLYAWHPLAVLEIAGQGHTEAAAVLGLVVALAALRSSRPAWGAAGLVAAGMTKLYPLLLLPAFLRRSGRKGVLAAALTGQRSPVARPLRPLLRIQRRAVLRGETGSGGCFGLRSE
jgi:hypothetical protein